MKKIFLFLIAAIMVLSLVGCTRTVTTTPTSLTTPVNYTTPPTTPVGTPVSFKVVKSDEPRIASPDITDTQLSTLVSGNNNFAFNLYQSLKMKIPVTCFIPPIAFRQL